MRIQPEIFVSDVRILVSSDGTELYAEAAGDCSKPAIVFIHGFFLSSIVFDGIFDDLSWLSKAYLVRYDVRGHGRSGKPRFEDAWESRRFAEDFDTVLQAFQLTKPFVAGWSLGATNIADILSFQEPAYLSGIIYIAPLPTMGNISQVMSDVCHECFPPLIENHDVDAYQEASNTFVSLCSTFMNHSMRLACLGSFLLQPRFVAMSLLSRTQGEAGLLRAGKEFGLPLLVFLGKKDDLIINEEIISWTSDWKKARVVEIDGDHTPWLGNPVLFRREVLDWVRTTASRC
ncbi:putative oxidoreductase ephD [Termitomyces sp. T112]|nr:putative oxidoreductase ephD [Termitomyces sp. T112]